MASLQKKIILFHLINILLSISMLMGCSSGDITQPVEPSPTDTPPPTPTPTPYNPLPQSDNDYEWWNRTVFYEIFVRSYFDSDEDGIGDLRGLTSKLDYLNDGNPNTQTDLGINGIWLMPVFAASSYHGYDVTDYYQINPEYGTIEDFEALLAEAHQRGIRIIIDFVINHTSSKHPWFRESRADINSPFRNWYIWSETNPAYLGPWDQRVWHFNYDNQYYYGVFTAEMPDLNFKNPVVGEEIYKIADFWVNDIGVDGFRVDGARHLIEEGKTQANSTETYLWFENFQSHLKNENNSFLTVGEVWDSNFAAVKYVKDGAFDLVFDFELSESILEGMNRSDAAKIRNALDFNTRLYPPLQKANFLTNHDMNRVMNSLLGEPDKAKAAALILLTSPGVPFIYYGEEIGMRGVKPDENLRRPMQWSHSDHAGFSTTFPWRDPDPEFSSNNVEIQNSKQDSLLNFYRSLIHIRNENEALQVGSFALLRSDEVGLVSYIRQYEGSTILVVLNAGKAAAEFSIEFSESTLAADNYQFTSLLDNRTFPLFTLSDGNGTGQYKSGEILQPMEYLLISMQEE